MESASPSLAYASKANIQVPDASGEAANVVTRATNRYADLPGTGTFSASNPSTTGETTRQTAALQD